MYVHVVYIFPCTPRFREHNSRLYNVLDPSSMAMTSVAISMLKFVMSLSNMGFRSLVNLLFYPLFFGSGTGVVTFL